VASTLWSGDWDWESTASAATVGNARLRPELRELSSSVSVKANLIPIPITRTSLESALDPSCPQAFLGNKSGWSQQGKIALKETAR